MPKFLIISVGNVYPLINDSVQYLYKNIRRIPDMQGIWQLSVFVSDYETLLISDTEASTITSITQKLT